MSDDQIGQIMVNVGFFSFAIWVLPLMFPRKDEQGREYPREPLVLVASHVSAAGIGVLIFLVILLLANHLSWR